MIQQSDIVVTHVNHNFGGAAQFKEMADMKKKIVINIEIDKNEYLSHNKTTI